MSTVAAINMATNNNLYNNNSNNNNAATSSSSAGQQRIGIAVSKIAELTLAELQEIAMRQQKQIEANQQLLNAKEKHLQRLKEDEIRTTTIATTSDNLSKLENLKQNVLGQELKILKLKQLRNQIIEHKLSNSHMYSELDLIKKLFADKEQELFEAIAKVSELTKQIEQMRKLKTTTASKTPAESAGGPNSTELEKMRQELHIRNNLNDQQAKKISQQEELFRQKQLEVLAIDKRIEDLQARIAAKRALNMQQQQQQHHFRQQQHLVRQSMSSDALESAAAVAKKPPDTAVSSTLQQQVASPSPSKLVVSVNSAGTTTTNTNTKFATKQEIANTYMNKFSSETYLRYQRLMQQQQQQQQQNSEQMGSLNATMKQLSVEAVSVNNTATTMTDQMSSSSTSSSFNSPPQPPPSAPSSNPIAVEQQQQQPTSEQTFDIASLNSTNANNNALPAHLRLEFDKIKYLPDMVKTIKKRHSISEIEGSLHTVPPQVFQKMLEKHHKNSQQSNNNDSQQQQSDSSMSKATILIGQPKTLNQIKEINEPLSPSSSPSITTKESAQQQDESQKEQQEQSSEFITPTIATTTVPKATKPIIKPTISKVSSNSIIPQQSMQFLSTFGQNVKNDPTATAMTNKKAVSFDPHALLLDAAVEGELDLVMRCAKLVRDVSEPNDEGITALHNSVCAGHFDIVKFLCEFGCDINYADNDGWTPLHCAASCNNLLMVKFLIEHGASLFATTVSDNETAIRKCEEDEEGYDACFEYLKSMSLALGDANVNGGLVYALYSYEEAENDDELTFKCNDKLVVLDKHEADGEANDGWWTAKLLDDGGDATKESRIGLVPRNYLGLYPRIQASNKHHHHQQESTIC